MFRKTALAFLVIVIVVAAAILVGFFSWRADRYEALRSGGRIAETSVGPVEYLMTGDSGPVMLFLHGVPGGYDQAPTERREGFRLLAPSRPGYLSTPIEVGRTPAEQARAYAALLDALGIESVVVMGVSGGGPSAVSFAAMYPERTIALIAMEAVTQPFTSEAGIPAFMSSDFLYWSLMSAVIGLQGPEAIVRAQIPDPANQARILADPQKLESFTRLVWSIGPASLRMTGWENDMQQMSALSLPASEVRVPTLILHGTDDAIVPIVQSEQLARQIPGARLEIIEGGDHMMPITHEAEINAVIGEFLRDQID